jgi:hypothetical protein
MARAIQKKKEKKERKKDHLVSQQQHNAIHILRFGGTLPLFFIYFYINRADIQYFIYTTRRAPLLYAILYIQTLHELSTSFEIRIQKNGVHRGGS